MATSRTLRSADGLSRIFALQRRRHASAHSPVVPSTSDGTVHRPEQEQDSADDRQHQSDDPQNADMGKEPDQQQDDAENDHEQLRGLGFGVRAV